MEKMKTNYSHILESIHSCLGCDILKCNILVVVFYVYYLFISEYLNRSADFDMKFIQKFNILTVDFFVVLPNNSKNSLLY